MMKNVKYSGAIHERDPDFIREIENGFKLLFPLRECHPEKIPEKIIAERDARVAQLAACRSAHEETKNQEVLLKSQTDKIEQTGDLRKIRKHLLLAEENKLYLDILEGRLVIITALSAEANKKYLEALMQSHDCSGCKWFLYQQQIPVCIFEPGKHAKPTAEIDRCPDPSGQMLDQGRPIIMREPGELPRQGVG